LVFGSKTGFSQIVLLLGGSLTQDKLYGNCREKVITNKNFLSTFGKIIKNKNSEGSPQLLH
jgi:hypothetical protein